MGAAVINRLIRTAHVYRRSYRNIYAYLRQTGDYRLLWEDLLYILSGANRPPWLP